MNHMNDMNNTTNSSDATTPHDALTLRMQRLEGQLAHLHTTQTRARTYKFVATLSTLGLVAVATVAATQAATQSARTPDVIRARRFEVVDQNDKVVLLAGIGSSGGQLDIWGNSGTNVVRLGSNNDGGDLAVWDSAGHGIAGDQRWLPQCCYCLRGLQAAPGGQHEQRAGGFRTPRPGTGRGAGVRAPLGAPAAPCIMSGTMRCTPVTTTTSKVTKKQR